MKVAAALTHVIMLNAYVASVISKSGFRGLQTLKACDFASFH